MAKRDDIDRVGGTGLTRRALLGAAIAAGTVLAGAPRGAAHASELGGGGVDRSQETDRHAEGRWIRGEYHTHSILSKDATNPYMAVANNLAAAFRDTAALELIDAAHDDAHIDALEDGGEFDYLIFADHLRRSHGAVSADEGALWDTPFYIAVREQERFVRDLQANGCYADKTIAFACEWDMPDMDHGAVLFHADGADGLPVEKIREFEWRFAHASGSSPTDGDDPTSMYADGGAEELALWGERSGDASLEHAYEGVRWMRENFPDGFVLINHPSRHGATGAGAVTVEKLRRLNDIAPDLVFGMEGMPGNQLSWNGGRGELPETYGGCDPMIAKTGGVWDALLGEGRRFWNFANADFHFKTSGGRYASGYWPSEYSCQHTFVKDTGDCVGDLVRGLRSGASFSVYGNLVDALEFSVEGARGSAMMGETLEAVAEETVRVTVRVHVPPCNNYRTIGGTDTGLGACDAPKLHHVDLIRGTVTGKVDEAEYASTGNADARIVKTFGPDEMGEADVDGFLTMVYEDSVPLGSTVYYRVRGTSVAAVDEAGDPLRDVDPSAGMTGSERFDYMNDYNYANLCFYANPVYAVGVDDGVQDARDRLSAAIGKAESYRAEGYTRESFSALEEALARGRSLLAGDASAEELLASAVAVETAIEGLVPAGAQGGDGTPGTDATDGGMDGEPDGGTARRGSTHTEALLPRTGDPSGAAMASTGLVGIAALGAAAAAGHLPGGPEEG